MDTQTWSVTISLHILDSKVETKLNIDKTIMSINSNNQNNSIYVQIEHNQQMTYINFQVCLVHTLKYFGHPTTVVLTIYGH